MKIFLNSDLRILIGQLLTKEAKNKIHSLRFKFRSKYKWLFRLIYGKANDEMIFNNILQKLDGKIDILMIHSSFNDMIPMYTGNLGRLLSMIISYCAQNDITLVMPTFFQGSNYKAKEHYESGKNIFDVHKTISEMGLLTELFRITPNVVRSIHPTHSICALGPLADKLTRNHHLADTTFGEGTPFGEMVKYRTIILGIGTKSLTQIHSAEDIMKGQYPIALYSEIIPVTCFDEMGNKIIYNFKIRNQEYSYNMKVVNKIFGNITRKWTYKGILFYLTQADSVNEAVKEAAKNGQTIYKLDLNRNNSLNKKLMKSFLKNSIREIISIVLTQESGNTVHASLFKFKNKYKWIPRLIYGTANDEEIFNNILQKLEGKFDILMIHSSFNGMIPMYTGNLNKLLSKILSYCNEKNITLAMPAFLQVFNYEAIKYYETNTFDVNKTLSGMGLLTELFRRTPDVKRSIHPTHSICAIGPLSNEIIENHNLANSTFGEGTPFEKMTKYKTLILVIGTDHNVVTQIHSAEDIMKEEFPFQLHSDAFPITCIDKVGNSLIYNLRVRKQDFVFNMHNVRKIFAKVKALKWTYKGIPFLLTEANEVTKTFIEAARNGKTIYRKRK